MTVPVPISPLLNGAQTGVVLPAGLGEGRAIQNVLVRAPGIEQGLTSFVNPALRCILPDDDG